MAKLGETQFYKLPIQGKAYYPGTKKRKLFEYVTSPWAGNVPQGYIPITREEFMKGAPAETLSNLVPQLQPGYIAPWAKQYVPEAARPTEEFFAPGMKQQAAKDWTGFQAEIASRAGKTPPVLGAGIGAGAPTAYDNLINQLTQAMTTAEAETPEMAGYKEKIGTFDEEIGKARDLLADLDSRIRRGMGREESRLAPMEVILGRQREIQRQAGEGRQDILATLESLQTGRGQALEEMERAEAERTRPLELLQAKVGMTKDILGLTEPKETKVSEFTDAQGNRIITFYDQRTGKTRTENVGKVDPGIETQVVEANGRKMLINRDTGETIKDLGEADVEQPEDVKEDILNIVNSAVDEYKLNPAGYREKFIELAVDRFGEEWRDFITKSVYTRMPDIIREAGGGASTADDFFDEL